MRSRGFTLIEALVTLLIMSIGMLGIAGIFAHGLQAERTAILRHQALVLAGDVADRIRANSHAGIAYQGTASGVSCLSEFALCDELSVAAHDIAEWQRQAAQSLPGGQVSVSFDDSIAPPTFAISITWSEPGARVPPGLALVIPVHP